MTDSKGFTYVIDNRAEKSNRKNIFEIFAFEINFYNTEEYT